MSEIKQSPCSENPAHNYLSEIMYRSNYSDDQIASEIGVSEQKLHIILTGDDVINEDLKKRIILLYCKIFHLPLPITQPMSFSW